MAAVRPESCEIPARSVELPALGTVVVCLSGDADELGDELGDLHACAAGVPWHVMGLRPHATLPPPPHA